MAKKLMTIVGTRPELIRLSEIIKLLDTHTEHIFVHTGQNFTASLHDQFFGELSLRKPDYQMNKEGKSGFAFIGSMLEEIEVIIEKENPEAILILGDTNSGLSAYVAKRKKIPVFHMEAGNRCYDETVPEEANRKIIDSLSTYLLPYTQRSRENLLREGYHPSTIIVTGNPITEIIEKHKNSIKERSIKEEYVLVTLHRDENITSENNLRSIVSALNTLSRTYRVVLSVHPKLSQMLEKYGIKTESGVEISEPFGFQKFLELEKYALCVLTDSGTVPEECAILGTPCVLMRTSTERPELLESNAMIMSGIREGEILDAFEVARKLGIGEIPLDYRNTDVSEKILKLMLKHIP